MGAREKLQISERAALGDRSAMRAEIDDAVVSEFVERHGGEVLSIARKFSDSAADAEDAYQRSLEVLLTKAPTEDPERLLSWVKTVVRNEALMMHRKQRRVSPDFDEVAHDWAADDYGPSERAVVDEENVLSRAARYQEHPAAKVRHGVYCAVANA